MARTIASLAVSLGMNSSGFTKGIEDANKKTGGLKKTLGTVTKGVGIAAGAVAAAGGAMFAMGVKASAAADAIDKTSSKLGISTDALQEMDYWASQNGVSQDSLERAVGRLNQRIGMAADGNDKYSEAFRRLDISLTDTNGTLRSTEDVMAETIQKLSEIEDPALRASQAAEIFGTSTARQLMPALQDGALSMEEAAKQAHNLGIVMSEEAIEASVQFQDSLDQVKRSLEMAFHETMVAVLPILQRFLDWILEHMPQIQATFGVVMEVISNVVSKAFEIIDDYVLPVLESLFKWVNENLPKIQSFFETAFRNIGEFTERLGSTTDEWWGKIKEIIMLVIELIQVRIELFIETIEYIWENWGEEIKRIAEGAWTAISSIIDGALTVIIGLLDVFIGLFTGDWERMSNGIETIWEGMWTAIRGVVEGAWNMLSGAFGILWGEISGWFTGLASDAYGWGRDIFTQMWDGLKSVWSSITSWLSSVRQQIQDAFKLPSLPGGGSGNFSPGGSQSFMDGSTWTPHATGLNYVPYDGYKAILHKGERVMTASENRASGSGGGDVIVQSMNVRSDNDIRQVAKELHELQRRASRGVGMA